jgi:aspartate aminotransferase/aminotransferase
MERFLKKCIKEEVLVVPGKAFSRDNTHFRVSYAVDKESLKRGMDILLKLA